MESRPPRPEEAFAKFTGSTSVILIVCVVSVIFISFSTAAVSWAVFAITRHDTPSRAVAGQVSPHTHFPIRERMLLGLFISHLWTSITFLISHLISFSHSSRIFLGPFCEIQTVAVWTGVLTTHLWTIALAAVTYLSIACPLGSIIPRIEGAWFGIGLWIYALAIGLSTGLWKLNGAIYIGGYCDFGGEAWKYNELINLIPRLCVLITILSIYVQLHILLRSGRKRVKDALQLKYEPGSQGLATRVEVPHTGSLESDTIPGSIVEENRLELWESGPTICGDQTTASPNLITESMADLINRKARTLVLLFPLSYTILVIVSLCKLVYDTTSSKPSVALHAIARWTLFLQGVLDALTYGWAGVRLKQSVRKLEGQQRASQ